MVGSTDEMVRWVEFITDDTPCASCGADGAVGYLDRWIGNANPLLRTRHVYFEGVMQGYGLDRVESSIPIKHGLGRQLAATKTGPSTPTSG